VSAALAQRPAALWALLFAAGRAAPIPDLARLLDCDAASVQAAAQALADHLGATGAPLAVEKVGSGYQLVVRPEYHPLARRLVGDAPARLSGPLLETLAVVAYGQPVSRGQVEAVRGVRAERSLALLAERGLVRETAAPPGAAAADGPFYATTREFLDAFGLAALADLPPWPGPDPQPRQLALPFGEGGGAAPPPDPDIPAPARAPAAPPT